METSSGEEEEEGGDNDEPPSAVDAKMEDEVVNGPPEVDVEDSPA